MCYPFLPLCLPPRAHWTHLVGLYKYRLTLLGHGWPPRSYMPDEHLLFLLSSCQLPVASQLEAELHEPLPCPCWHSGWLGLVQTLWTQAQLSTHMCWHVQQILFWSRYPLLLDLTAFLPAPPWCWDLQLTGATISRYQVWLFTLHISLETEWLPWTLPSVQSHVTAAASSDAAPLCLFSPRHIHQFSCYTFKSKLRGPVVLSPFYLLNFLPFKPSSKFKSDFDCLGKPVSLDYKTICGNRLCFMIFSSVLQCYEHYLEKCLNVYKLSMHLSYNCIVSIFTHS